MVEHCDRWTCAKRTPANAGNGRLLPVDCEPRSGKSGKNFHTYQVTIGIEVQMQIWTFVLQEARQTHLLGHARNTWPRMTR